MRSMILPLLIFLFPLAYSPGPGNMIFAAAGARFGIRATLPANAGYHLATLAVTLPIGLGFAGAAQAVPGLAAGIQVMGSLYVLWLAVALMRADAAGMAEARPMRFGDGVALLLLNPKAYVIIVLMFTQFPGGPASSGPWAIGILTVIFTLNNLIAFLVWTTLGDIAARRLRDSGRAGHLNIGFGAMLGSVGVWMLLA